jgi:hypothetical protein
MCRSDVNIPNKCRCLILFVQSGFGSDPIVIGGPNDQEMQLAEEFDEDDEDLDMGDESEAEESNERETPDIEMSDGKTTELEGCIK